MFGVAEDHDSNPIKIGLGHLKTRGGTKFVSVNPIRTGYSRSPTNGSAYGPARWALRLRADP